MMNAQTQAIQESKNAARAFLGRVSARYPVTRAIMFGSRARGAFRTDSDLDIAVLLCGQPGQRVDAALDMAGIAFDVLLETGILVEALPLWEEEWEHPEQFNNPALIENIRRDGIWLLVCTWSKPDGCTLNLGGR